MTKNRTIPTLLATAVVALGTGAGVAQAKHGADDAAGHQRHSHVERGDDHGRKSEAGDDRRHRHAARENERRHGSDDAPGHR